MGCRSPIAFGSDATRDKYLKLVEQALQMMAKQRTRWAVAPLLMVTTPKGLALSAGSEVTLAMMSGGELPAQVLIRKLVSAGHLLENDNIDDGPQVA